MRFTSPMLVQGFVAVLFAVDCSGFTVRSCSKQLQSRAQTGKENPIYRFSGQSCSRGIRSQLVSSSESEDHDTQATSNELQERRAVLGSLVSAVALSLGTSRPASAFQKEFPQDLDFENGDTSRDLTAIRNAKIDAAKAYSKQSNDYVSSKNPLFFRGPKDLLSSAVWGGAIWLLLGSRSNPIVTPLANMLYDDENEAWLKDRNEGLFGSLPAPFLIALGVVFFFLGIATDRIVLFVAEGDTNVCLQLAGVSLIGGGALELGRIASGEKKQTREDFDRDSQLEQEFAEFAERRLVSGGNCHRSEVVKAFRRYFAKYRQADSVEYPLSDLEIERLLRNWNRKFGNGDMSSAGFFTGIQINDQADVFVNR